MLHPRVPLWLLAVFSCTTTYLASAQQDDGITGVLEPDIRDLGQYEDIVSATIDVLPEVTEVLNLLTSEAKHTHVSDTNYIEKVVSSFLPLSKKVYIADAEVNGKRIDQDQISRLNAAELVVPSVFHFMNKMRSSQFFDKPVVSITPRKPLFSSRPHDFKTAAAAGGSDPLGRYRNMVAATNSLLPVLTDVFKKITTDPERPKPSDPKFIEKMMVAFLPATQQVLEAAYKAEGKIPMDRTREHLDRSKPVMPNVFNFFERMRKSNFYEERAPMKRQEGFSAGSFKFNDNEQSTLIKIHRMPKISHYGGLEIWPASSGTLPNYEYTVPKPAGYYEVYKGTSLGNPPSSRSASSLPNYKYTL